MKNNYERLGLDDFHRNIENALKLSEFFETFESDIEVSRCLQFYIAAQLNFEQDVDDFFDRLKSNCIILAENLKYFYKEGTNND